MNFRFQVTEMIEWGVNQNPKNPWGLHQTGGGGGGGGGGGLKPKPKKSGGPPTNPPPPPRTQGKNSWTKNSHAKFSEPLKFAPRKQLLNNIIQRMKTLEIEC